MLRVARIENSSFTKRASHSSTLTIKFVVVVVIVIMVVVVVVVAIVVVMIVVVVVVVVVVMVVVVLITTLTWRISISEQVDTCSRRAHSSYWTFLMIWNNQYIKL